MILIENDILQECCEGFYKQHSISKEYVEKDFFAISILKLISSKAENVVFKGGTCLSKCYKLINRFSEDIDISIIEEHLSESKRRNLVHNIIENSIKDTNCMLLNPNNIRSRRIFNRFIAKYNSIFENSSSDENVIIELAMISPCFPYKTMKIQTFVGEYLDSIGRNDLTQKYKLEPFDVKVQTLERTFVDKIFALCDYQISKKLTRQSRHIYDLHKIFPLIIFDNDLLVLFDQVKKYRINNPTCYSAKEGQKLGNIFQLLIDEKTFEHDFNNVTKLLLYDNTSYEQCIETMLKIAKYLKENNL